VVGHHAEELEVEDVEVRVLVYRDLLQKRLAQDSDGYCLDLLVERNELSDELLPYIPVLVELNEEECEGLVDDRRVLVPVKREMVQKLEHLLEGHGPQDP
jgi:hypothetical protein